MGLHDRRRNHLPRPGITRAHWPAVTRTLPSLLLCLGLVGVALPSTGCSDDPDSTSSNQTSTKATLELHALDLWGQPLPEEGLELVVLRNGQQVAGTWVDAHTLRLPLSTAATYEVLLSAPDHHALRTELRFDGSSLPVALSARRGADDTGHGVTVSHAMPSGSKPVHRVQLGLRHKWFSASGRPARRGNYVDLLLDGEEAYARVHSDLVAAKSEVLASTWWWESSFELIRPKATHATMSPEARRANTVMSVMSASPATKRVLVGQLWGQDGVLSGFTVDDELKAKGAAANDGFEFMGQANRTRGKFRFEVSPFAFGDRVEPNFPKDFYDDEPLIASTVKPKDVDLTQWPIEIDTEHASMHQKFMVIDHEVAHIGGMNLRRVDWDTSDHLVFEPRRMLIDATNEARAEVAAKTRLPDTGPRKDYIARIEGPAAQDAADVFQRRWEIAKGERVEFHQNASTFEVKREIAERSGGVQAQVTATLPQPWWEHSIAETWLNAIEQAEDYVFIEDQYFRAPILNDALIARMREEPGLRLVVITKPINEWTDPGCRWTYESAELFAKEFPGRFLFLQLRAFDTQVTWGVDETDAHFQNMDVHSKLFIVDDKFLSVGSANKNNRGMIYEAELNLAVFDAEWVRLARRRVLGNVLPSGEAPEDGASAWFAQLAKAASYNDAVYARWDAEGMDISLDGAPVPVDYRPRGFLYTLPFRTVSDCLFESVGPDMTGGERPEGTPPSSSGPEGSGVE